jgi:putative redox protein
MEFTRLTFENDTGEKLAGRIDFSPDEPDAPVAIVAHCFTCSKDFNAAAHISRALARGGISVMRFDFTGLGESEGSFAATSFSSNVSDLVAAASYLGRHYRAPQLLVGHSFGGTACLKAALEIPSVRAVVTIGSPAQPSHVQRHLAGAQETIRRNGEADVLVAGRPFTIGRQFVDDAAAVDMSAVLPALKRPLLILHSPVDEVVGVDNAARLFQAARHPKSFVSLDSADHMMNSRRDAEYAAALITAWAVRYIGPSG